MGLRSSVLLVRAARRCPSAQCTLVSPFNDLDALFVERSGHALPH
jgi:hypothetical protein